MPDTKKDVFKILAEMRRLALGINDQNPQGMKGMVASFMPSGEPVNPDDFKNPWKPNMTSPSKVEPPPPAGTDPGTPDTSDIGKRYENLANTCTLVDRKLQFNEIYQAIKTGASISQAWEIIVTGANVMPLPPEQEEFQKKQRDKYLPRLRKTIKDEDGSDMDVDTKEYKAYKDYEKKYQNAIRAYTAQYLVAMSSRATAQTWGVLGKTYIQDVNDAWDEWTSLGNKQYIEEARDNLAAMGTDAAAHMIAAAKKKFEAYQVATQGVIPVTTAYTELFPSNWAEIAPDDGWSTYHYDWQKQTTTTDAESSSFSGSASISVGFWSFGANASYEKRTEHDDMKLDGLSIDFSYALVEINRPWLDALLFDLGNWFLVGNYPKGSISTGQMGQILPDTAVDTWLPIIPQQMFVIKNLKISTTDIHNTFDSLSTKVSGGGGIGIGPFHLGGQYSHSKDTKTWVAEKTGEGLEVKGAQIMGWISNLVPLSPKIDAPKEEKKTDGVETPPVAEPVA
jgi:hypothetical protein